MRAAAAFLVAVLASSRADAAAPTERPNLDPSPPETLPDAGPIELPPPEDPGGEAGGADRKLQIYGFADIEYFATLMPKSNPWHQYFAPHDGFIFGNLNLYLARELGTRARSMAEVRFLFAPQGTATMAADGTVTRTETETQDFVEYGRTIKWGGVQIERAWVEYDLLPFVTARAGHFLTPYGIWNVDHGSPSLIGARRPWIVREQLFPERQTGLELHGRRAFGALSLGYHLTLSNGRGPSEAQFDTDENKALGGRLLVEWRGDYQITGGVSGYKGRATAKADRWVTTDIQDRRRLATWNAYQFDETALAGDFRLQGRHLLLQSELILNERAYVDPYRPLLFPSLDALTPDLRRWGAYGLVGWRFAWLGVMPYLIVEFVDLDSGSYPLTPGPIPHIMPVFCGLNIRPQPDLVLKIEGFYSSFPGAPKGGWADHAFYGLQTQVAWVF